jgi:vacuolar protein sorting-associated protein 26
MDGQPFIEEAVPIRFNLSSVSGLTPSQKNINNKFNCSYFINVIFYDEENRKYFKQHEIEMYRKKF